MAILFNPGSDHKGGTLEVAIKRAEWVLKYDIIGCGIVDVELIRKARKTDLGWAFMYRHNITGAEIEYDTHGLYEVEDREEQDKYVFKPRDYWNGSSSSNPSPEDWIDDAKKWQVIHVIKAVE